MLSMLPGRQVVEDVDLVAVREQRIAEMGSDEAGPAGDQTAHLILRPVRSHPMRSSAPGTKNLAESADAGGKNW